MSDRLALRVLIGLAIALLLFWVMREVIDLLNRFGRVIALFFFAWLISFVLGPPTDSLVRAGVRRPLAVTAVFVLTFTVLFTATLLLIPVFADQANDLRETVNAYTAQTPALLTLVEERALDFGLSETDLRNFYLSLVDQARAFTGQMLQNTIGLLTGAAGFMIDLMFCLIISVYLMLDGRRILAATIAITPNRYRPEVRAVTQSINDNFGGYVRGTLILSTIYGVAIALVMVVVGLEYKASSAIFAGLALIIPFAGPAISLLPALLVALLTRPTDLWWIALVLLVVQQVVLNVAGPRVFGRTVNMHPLLVIGAALTGAALAGFWGALFGIPVAGIIASVIKRLSAGSFGSEDGEAVATGASPEPALAPDAAASHSTSRPS
ncbi:MAG: AI-2E family transporter [Chloroflexi bacterium]|nr:AI-2E family transporter [Chloroflexota bacterium]